MELPERISVLADAAKYDASCASSGVRRSNGGRGLGNATGSGICHSYTPDGRCVSLLKLLLTNRCIHDCSYCVNRVSNEVPRVGLRIDEVVQLTVDFYRRNYIEGLFLSSGVDGDADRTMERLAEVARRLREDEGFHGYIHLKAVVGASEEVLARAGRYADRLSANIELPLQRDLDRLAPERSIDRAEETMRGLADRVAAARAERARRASPGAFAPAGQSTQMIVGATETPDREILATADRLYSRHRLRRVYYTAYSPIDRAHHELPTARVPLVREHRLYQADWLVRFYGFEARELVVRGDGNLDLDVDPKTAWALVHREHFPVDVNTATREELLRVPGLGTKSVQKILSARRRRRLRRADLAQLRAPLRRMAPFIVTADDRRSAGALDSDALAERVRPRERQLTLFEARRSALDGQV